MRPRGRLPIQTAPRRKIADRFRAQAGNVFDSRWIRSLAWLRGIDWRARSSGTFFQMSTEKTSIDFIDSYCREVKLQLRLSGPTSICHVFQTARPTTSGCCLWPVTSRVTSGALSPELLTLQPASRRVASYYFVNNSISMFPPVYQRPK